jgi:CRP/FNR family transcriptional regulator, cyclic AMP receptor protein
VRASPAERRTFSCGVFNRTPPGTRSGVTGMSARTPRALEALHLLQADPELGALLTPERRAEAERELLVRTHRIGVGPWDVSRLTSASADHVGLLVLDGVLSRELVVADQVSAELLGPGDLVRPWQGAGSAGLLPVQAVWSVLSTVTLAVLDRRFAVEAARYPEVTAALFERLGERSLRLATTQAISQLTRVDRRLKALFWHLAERWGRVSGDGVVVPLALTHRILGQLVGARRPTVSTALSELAERQELIRRPDGSWLLRGDPPDAQMLARKPTAAELRGQDVLRPSRRFSRSEDEDVQPDQLIAAMDRLREALDPGELKDLLERRRGAAR